MNKIKEYFKVKKNIAIFSVCSLLVITAVVFAVLMLTRKPPVNDVIATVKTSENTSSETVSSKTTVKVAEIVAPSSKEPVSSKDTLELKVEGNPTSKAEPKKEQPKPAQRPSSSKPVEKAKPKQEEQKKPAEPKSNTPKDGDTKLENGSWYTYWAADGQWHYDAPEDGGGKSLEEQRADNEEFIKNYHCDKCGGDFYSCKCKSGDM